MFQYDEGNFEFTAETLEHLTPTAGHFELTSGTYEVTYNSCLDIVSSDDLMGVSGNERSLRHATFGRLHKKNVYRLHQTISVKQRKELRNAVF